MSLEQLRLNSDPMIAVILVGVMTTTGVRAGDGAGVSDRNYSMS